MKTLFLAILILTSVLPGRANDLAQEVGPLLQSIRATLPKGWTVKFGKEALSPIKVTHIETDKFGKKVEVQRVELLDLGEEGSSLLAIERVEPVAGEFCAPNMSSYSIEESRPKMERYRFTFDVGDLVTAAPYQQWVAENAEIQKKASVIYDDFERRRQLSKGVRSWAKTDADKVALARYDELIDSKHNLPDFYFQKVSLWWLWGSPQNSVSFVVKDDRLRAECDGVKEKILKLFSKYQAT